MFQFRSEYRKRFTKLKDFGMLGSVALFHFGHQGIDQLQMLTGVCMMLFDDVLSKLFQGSMRPSTSLWSCTLWLKFLQFFQDGGERNVFLGAGFRQRMLAVTTIVDPNSL